MLQGSPSYTALPWLFYCCNGCIRYAVEHWDIANLREENHADDKKNKDFMHVTTVYTYNAYRLLPHANLVVKNVLAASDVHNQEKQKSETSGVAEFKD